MKCDNCGAQISRHQGEFFELYRVDLDIVTILCNPSCLVEYAWKLKEAQPKLSKSRNQ